MSGHIKGFLYLMFSAVFFGTMPLLTKFVCAGGTNVLSVIFLRFFIALLPLFICLKVKGIPLAVTKEEVKQIVKIAALGYGVTGMMLYLSYDYIPSGMATVIHFVYPVFVLLGGIIFLKQKATRTNVMCVLLCLCGIILSYGGNGEGAKVAGFLLAFLSGITYAFYILYLDYSGLQNMPMLKLIFYMNIVASAVTLGIGLVTGRIDITISGNAWIAMLVLSLGATFVGVAFFQRGEQLVGPQNASILSTFEPVTSMIIGVLVLNERMTFWSVAGCLLILISVVITAMQGEKTNFAI